MSTTVAVFGAGIAGLSAAHELARRGYQVSIYEATEHPGGFFRSDRQSHHANMPSEYSWHGMGPWYHNTFDLMRQIPLDALGSVFDRGLSRPIDFCVAADNAPAGFFSGLLGLPGMFRMGRIEGLRWAWLLLKTFAAGRRSEEAYARRNAAEAWRPLLSPAAWRIWRSTFGPWIGSDWLNVSLHTAGRFFFKQLTSHPAHPHAADEEGPAWTHGARDGWLLLRGPSSECWFDPWVDDLKWHGVQFFWNTPLHRLDFDGTAITAAHLASGQRIVADHYVLATTPFAAADILERTPELAARDQLRLFRPLTQRGPHTQVSFRIAFAEPIAWPRPRTAVVVANSEFNLTLFAQEQVWRPEVSLGDQVRSLWTGTACVATIPGPLHGLPLLRCTKQQFIEEILTQLGRCGGLDRLVREANSGRSWKEIPIIRIEVWHEWEFSPEGLEGPQPKWVNTTDTQPFQPTQATPIVNLVLAGAHTRTQADVWSIEGAVESGRRAAQIIEPTVNVVPQHTPIWLRVLRTLDDGCYALGMPHVLDLLALASVMVLVGFLIWLVLG